MTNQFKRIIAREGLVLLATFGIGTILISLALYFRPSLDDIFNNVFNNVPLTPKGTIPWGTIIGIGQTFLVAYPIYLLIRFIFWAIKTLELQKSLTAQVKRTIAREALMLLGIILLGGLFFKTGELGFKYFFKDYYWQEIVVPKKDYAILSEQDKKEAHKQYENEFKPDISWSLKHRDPETFFWSILVILGKWILFLGYPAYLLVRLIAWAIRTLRTKND